MNNSRGRCSRCLLWPGVHLAFGSSGRGPILLLSFDSYSSSAVATLGPGADFLGPVLGSVRARTLGRRRDGQCAGAGSEPSLGRSLGGLEVMPLGPGMRREGRGGGERMARAETRFLASPGALTPGCGGFQTLHAFKSLCTPFPQTQRIDFGISRGLRVEATESGGFPMQFGLTPGARTASAFPSGALPGSPWSSGHWKPGLSLHPSPPGLLRNVTRDRDEGAQGLLFNLLPRCLGP